MRAPLRCGWEGWGRSFSKPVAVRSGWLPSRPEMAGDESSDLNEFIYLFVLFPLDARLFCQNYALNVLLTLFEQEIRRKEVV